MEAAAILGPDKEGEEMKTEHSYSAKGVLAALGRSALYQLFFVAVQVLLPFVYGIGIAADAAINRGADLAQGGRRRWRSGFLTACRRSRCYRV